MCRSITTVWVSAAGAGLVLAVALPASSYSTFYLAFTLRYPDSTLPQRMADMTGSGCNVCHHFYQEDPGNCYREDIKALINQGMSIQDALAAVEGLDSDGDGVTNLVEIMRARPNSTDVGYNPGLVGDLGTDPCGTDPEEVISGVSETPCLADWNGDGSLDAFDYDDYVSAFFVYITSGTGFPDYNGDGTVDAFDYDDFVSAFFAGC